MKSIFTFLLALGLSATAYSQHQLHSPCLYDHAVHARDAQYPGYKAAADATFQEALAHVDNYRGNAVDTINVVVHVVWKDSAENLPMSRIQDQLDVLNEDYRRLNADAVNLRQTFVPIAGDAMIHFNLAHVEWINTNATFTPTLQNPTIDQVKHTAQGGADAWDVEHYLNIWVCAIQPLVIFGQSSQILGYAYPPAGLANWPAGSEAPDPSEDGVVIDYHAFGRNLTFPMQGMNVVIEGRTPTHEVGHYLGLRHIWGDGLLAQFGIPDCNATDGVADTPSQGTPSQFDCDTTRNTCDDGAGDKPDMIEDFMDYAAETCMNSFTQGQVDIMRAVLGGPRNGLLQPLGVHEAQSIQFANVFPNPSSGTVFVNLKFEAVTPYNIQIHNALGQTVAQQVGDASQQVQTSFDLSHCSPGMYFVEIRTQTGTLVKKVMVAF